MGESPGRGGGEFEKIIAGDIRRYPSAVPVPKLFSDPLVAVNSGFRRSASQNLEHIFSKEVNVHQVGRASTNEEIPGSMSLIVQPKGSESLYHVLIWKEGPVYSSPIRVKHLGRIRVRGDRPSHTQSETPCLSLTELSSLLNLSDVACADIREVAQKFPMKVPRYYAQLMKEHEVLRQIVVPSLKELIAYRDDVETDVHADESRYQPVEGIVHRYSGKLLFFPTLICFGHCRFCFRAGHHVKPLSAEKIDAAIDYIRKRKDIREVIITGGDPLTLSVDALDDMLSRIRAIDHVEIIRIGTRALAFKPQVITRALVDMLRTYNPLFMTLSFVHPDEISPYCEEKLNMLADAGIVMLQQGPILKGVNDDAGVLKSLYEKLAKNRVLAYYAIYGIYAPGVRHFIVTREEVRAIFSNIENRTSGHCLPHLITLDQGDNKTRSVL